MTMPVTDHQVAALRAQLAGDTETHFRLLNQLDRAEANKGYAALVAGAFFEAVDRRFAGKAKLDDVIQFVSRVRGATESTAESVDPSAAERLILVALGEDVNVDDLDGNATLGTQILLLGVLIHDEQLDAAGVDAFLVEARKAGDFMLRKKYGE